MSNRQRCCTRTPAWSEMRPYEIAGRWIDYTLDFAANGDSIPSLDAVSVSIARADGWPMAPGDLTLTGEDSLDPTGLVLTIGFQAPMQSAGRTYRVTVTVEPSAVGDTVESAVYLPVACWCGEPPPAPPTRFSQTIPAEATVTTTPYVVFQPSFEIDAEGGFDPDTLSYVTNVNNYATLTPEGFVFAGADPVSANNIDVTAEAFVATFATVLTAETSPSVIAASFGVFANSVAYRVPAPSTLTPTVSTAFQAALIHTPSATTIGGVAAVAVTTTVLSGQTTIYLLQPVASASAQAATLVATNQTFPAAFTAAASPALSASAGTTIGGVTTVSATAAIQSTASATIAPAATITTGTIQQLSLSPTITPTFGLPATTVRALLATRSTVPVLSNLPAVPASVVVRPVTFSLPATASLASGTTATFSLTPEIDTTAQVFAAFGAPEARATLPGEAFANASLTLTEFTAPITIGATAAVSALLATVRPTNATINAVSAVAVPSSPLIAQAQASSAPAGAATANPGLIAQPTATLTPTVSIFASAPNLAQVSSTINVVSAVTIPQTPVITFIRPAVINVTAEQAAAAVMARAVVSPITMVTTVQTGLVSLLLAAPGTIAASFGVTSLFAGVDNLTPNISAVASMTATPSVAATTGTVAVPAAAGVTALIASRRPATATLPAAATVQPGLAAVFSPRQTTMAAVTAVQPGIVYVARLIQTIPAVTTITLSPMLRANMRPQVAPVANLNNPGGSGVKADVITAAGTGPFSAQFSSQFDSISNVNPTGFQFDHNAFDPLAFS